MDQKLTASNENSPQTANSDKAFTHRFMMGVAVGVLIFVLILFGLGAVLTHFLWPPQDKLSRPVEYHE